MNRKPTTATHSCPTVRCAIYTRKSTEAGLEQEFNSLDAQRESAEAFIKSQTHEGWECLPERYDDGGFTGGNLDRPALQRLVADIEAGKIDCVVIYKVDRLSRSLLDFARLMETFEKHHVAFVSITQQFNTASSMGRLVLNVLLSFAQFEREIISERTRDKIAATRRKGKWSGGPPLLGYDIDARGSGLIVNEDEAVRVRAIFQMYLDYGALLPVVRELERRGWTKKRWQTRRARQRRRADQQIGPASLAHQRRLCRQGALQERSPPRRASRARGRRYLAEGTSPSPTERQKRGWPRQEHDGILAEGLAALFRLRLCDDSEPHPQRQRPLPLLRLYQRPEAGLGPVSVEVDPRG